MKRISTPYSFSIKLLPILSLSVPVLVVAVVLYVGVYEESPMLIVIPCVMAVIGYHTSRIIVRDLADEVYDCGDFLLIRKRGEEDRVPLSRIINVNFAANLKPARITLTLASPGKFGTEVSFIPPARLYIHPLPKNEVADDLIARAARARSKS
jgi:hypothetical protein